MKNKLVIAVIFSILISFCNSNPVFALCGGTERWFVKVGTDPDADKVNVDIIVPTTVQDLNNLPQLRDRVPHGDNKLRLPEEKTVYTVKGYLTLFKYEDDNDYHLVITDDSLQYTPGGPGTDGLETGTSFIAEIPDPECVAGKKGDPTVPSVFDTKLQEVRRKFEDKFPSGSPSKNLNVPVTITGVLFYDRMHHQTGRAVNGVELHPLLDISFDSGTTPPSSNIPTTSPEEGSVVQLVANSGFEEGITGWNGAVEDIGSFRGASPHSGNNVAWMGGTGKGHTENLSQNISIPSSVSKATMSFWLRIETEEVTPNQPYDKLDVQLNDSKGKKLKLLKQYSNLDAANNYVRQSVDVSEYIGSKIQLYFKATEDDGKLTSFLVDDIVITAQ